MSFSGYFAHTTGKTWGGSQISPTSLQAASILGGFFGLDHLLLRSPITAMLKTIVNFLTLGFWYWYDVVQTMGDMEFVKQYGYTIPIIGPTGLGTGIVGDTKGKGAAPEGTPNPWIFVAYIFALLLPFGISNFLAGDFQGGSAKFFLTFIPLTTILGLIWTAYSLFYGVFKPQTLLTHGTDRFFPANLIMKPYGPAVRLTPPEMYVAEAEAQEDSIFTKIYNMIFGVVEKPILEAVVGATQPIVDTAQEIKNTAAATNETTTGQTGGALNTVTTTAAILASQQGGGPDSTSKALFLGAAALICIGSITLTYFRYWGSKGWGGAKKEESSEYIDKNDIPPEGLQNDTPPGPRVL